MFRIPLHDEYMKGLVWDTDTLSWVSAQQSVINTDTLTVAGSMSVSNFPTTQQVSDIQYIVKLDDSSDTIKYIGEAVTGSAEDSSVWRIRQLNTTSGVSVLFADGNVNFDNRWDQRALKSYS